MKWIGLFSLLFVSCQNSSLVSDAMVMDGMIQVDYVEMMRATNYDKTVIIDVRTREEYDLGHVTGAVLIPYDQIKYRMAEINDYEQVILYCGTNRRATIAYEYLKDHFDEIFIFYNGYNNCQEC